MKWILSGSSTTQLGKQISEHSKIPLLKNYIIHRFADNEIRIEIHDSIQNDHIYLIQSTCPPVNDHYMELFLLIDALRRKKVSKITLIMPYYGYSRQDRVVADGSPLSAECIAQILQQSKINELICLDLHSEKIKNFFHIPVQNLSAYVVMAEHWQIHHSQQNVVCLSPDQGGLNRVRSFAKQIGCSIACIQKERKVVNQAHALSLEGSVKGKNVIILDDMIDTAGTLCTAVDKLSEYGAKDIFVMATHGLFSEPAISRIENSQIRKIWITNSIQLGENILQCDKIQVLSIASLIASSIQ